MLEMTLTFAACAVPSMSASSRCRTSSSLRILCLHGCGPNAAILYAKSGKLRKAIAKAIPNAELVFIDAPNVVEQGTGSSAGKSARGFTWNLKARNTLVLTRRESFC
jgi:hypothetical protein